MTRLTLTATESDAHTTVLSAVGELDLATAHELYRSGAAALEHRPTLVLEMSEIGFCDSSGFNALLRLRRRAEEQRGSLVLAAPPEVVRRLLALTGAGAVFAIHDDLTEALAAIRTRRPCE